jgi:hypothetical protein
VQLQVRILLLSLQSSFASVTRSTAAAKLGAVLLGAVFRSVQHVCSRVESLPVHIMLVRWTAVPVSAPFAPCSCAAAGGATAQQQGCLRLRAAAEEAAGCHKLPGVQQKSRSWAAMAGPLPCQQG